MKKLKLLLVLFIGIALSTAYSCNKDDEDDNGGGDGGGGTTPKTCYIKKETYADGSYSQIEYNSNHKAIKVTEYDSTGKVDERTELSYDSNGKIIKMENFDGTTLSGKFEYSYDAQGKLSKADIFGDQGGTFKKIGYYEYTFTGDNLTKLVTKVEYLGQTIEAEKVEFTYSGGNAVTQKDYAFDYGSLSLKLEFTTTYEYDTKINPYRGLGANYIMGDPQFISKANVTKMTVKDNQGIVQKDQSSNITYEYNDSNYPTKATDVSFDNSETDVTIFDYDCI